MQLVCFALHCSTTTASDENIIYLSKKKLWCFFRYGCMQEWLQKFEESEGGIENFTKAYEYYGIHVRDDNSVVAREWAPGAVAVYLTGDFSE